MRNQIQRVAIRCSWLLFAVSCVPGCSDDAIENRLKSLSGNEYLALSQVEKDDLVKESLDRYTTWKFWQRPDLCDYVLDTSTLSLLYEKAAKNAKEDLMIHSFVAYANEQCIGQGQF